VARFPVHRCNHIEHLRDRSRVRAIGILSENYGDHSVRDSRDRFLIGISLPFAVLESGIDEFRDFISDASSQR
jgi:hypothetical protein